MLQGFKIVDLGIGEKTFITIADNRYIKFSRDAAQYVGEKVAVYENGELLAFVTEDDGQLKVCANKNGDKFITCAALYRKIVKKYGCNSGTRLKAWVDEGVLIFTKNNYKEAVK